MAALTKAQFRTESLAVAGDPSADFFSDNTRIDRIVKHAAEEVVGIIDMANEDYFTKTATLSVVSGTTEYTLASDVKYLRRVTRPASSGSDAVYDIIPIAYLEVAEYQSRLISTDTGSIVAYYLRSNQIGFVPKPTAAVTVTYWYSARVPEPTTDTASLAEVFPHWPVEWDQLVVIKTAIRMKLEMNEPVKDLQQREAQLQDRLVREVRRRKRSMPRTVRFLDRGQAI